MKHFELESKGFRADTTYKDVFYTNNIRQETTLPNFIDQWFERLETNINGYKVNAAAGNSNKPVSKGWFLYGHSAVGFTYEIGDNTKKDDIVDGRFTTGKDPSATKSLAKNAIQAIKNRDICG